MKSTADDPRRPFPAINSLYPKREALLSWWGNVIQGLGVVALCIRHGLRPVPGEPHLELGLITLAAMALLTASTGLKYYWSLAKRTWLRDHRARVAVALAWPAGFLLITIFTPVVAGTGRGTALLLWSELCLLVSVLISGIYLTRRAAGRGLNPAVLLAVSFALLIAVGAGLLLLPRSRSATAAQPSQTAEEKFRVALFTSTSACCVTGLVIKNTGDYWSRFGQSIILGLIQLGGLGIMSCGAFFALAAGGNFRVRERATLRDIFESEDLDEVKRLVWTILIFTFSVELLGALLSSGLWADKPWGDRIFYSLFHSVSAFCNAGFALTENSLFGWGTRWEVWGVVCAEIILGGLGFAVVYNVSVYLKSRFTQLTRPPLFSLSRQRVRLTLSSRLVLNCTALLLVGGMLGYFVLESMDRSEQPALTERIGDAWFQSVTFRTAGFNTVNHVEMQPATKLLGIFLMFVGASPGSTGGGVKTTCFTIALLSLLSVLRGQSRVEIAGRTIPDFVIYRALSVISLGMATVFITTLLLVLFERQPERFLDHLFEATSAFATVGVSADVTHNLTPASQYVLIVTMFLGRVGPLTLMLALTSQQGVPHYEYPKERVVLG